MAPLADIARRELIVGGALGLAAASGMFISRATATEPRRIDVLDKIIPSRVGNWRQAPLGDTRLPVGEAPDDSVYDQLLTRVYTDPGAVRIMLLVAYGGRQSGDTSVHRPEICYPAAGYTLERQPDVALGLPNGATVSAVRMTARAPGRVEQLLYWTRIGHDFPTTDLAQRLSMLTQSFHGTAPDGVLVRISTVDPDFKSATSKLTEFAQAMLRLEDHRAQSLLVGHD